MPYLTWYRPRSYCDVVGTHLPLALLTGIALGFANCLPMKLFPIKSCTFLWLTGYPCPFCGFTRSFWAMAQGEWHFAFYNAPLACLLYVAAWVLFAWNVTGLLLGLQLRLGKVPRRRVDGVSWGLIMMISLFVTHWVYRLALGLK